MGATFSSAALTFDIRSLPMSSVVMAVGALGWVAKEAIADASVAAASDASSVPAPMDAAALKAFKPVVLVTAGWALMYYAMLFDQSASAFVVFKDAKRAAKKAGGGCSLFSFGFFFLVEQMRILIRAHKPFCTYDT